MELVHIEIRDILKKKIEKIFERKFENIDVQYSTKKEFGDFQTNFSLINSEIIGKKPREIGKMIIKSLENDKKNDINCRTRFFKHIFEKFQDMAEFKENRN